MKKKKLIFVYFIYLFLFLFFITFLTDVDLIWGYGFSYNIASGLVPYRDFNMVIGPIYSILMSISIKIFGNYYLVFGIEHAIIYSFILTLVYKKIGFKSIFVFISFTLSIICGYNSFCIMLIILIMLLYDSNFKYKNILIGLIVGSIIFIKQNIGFAVFLVYIFSSKNKIKSILSVGCVGILVLLYLIFNNILFYYIDYCIIGMGSFLSNFYIDIFGIIIIIGLLYFSYKEWKNKKDVKILYCLACLVVSFPIFNKNHITVVFGPFIYYILINCDYKKKFFSCYSILIFSIIGFISSLDGTFYLDNNYLFFEYLPKNIGYYLENYSNYIDNNSDAEIYLLMDNAYLIRIYMNQNPNKYDLINNGNFGSEEFELINKMGENCINKKCLFILDSSFFVNSNDGTGQRSMNFKNYVLDNYEYKENIMLDRVYSNFK